MKSEEFDRAFDDGEHVTSRLDTDISGRLSVLARDPYLNFTTQKWSFPCDRLRAS
jgi:hypothetical protein